MIFLNLMVRLMPERNEEKVTGFIKTAGMFRTPPAA